MLFTVYMYTLTPSSAFSSLVIPHRLTSDFLNSRCNYKFFFADQVRQGLHIYGEKKRSKYPYIALKSLLFVKSSFWLNNVLSCRFPFIHRQTNKCPEYEKIQAIKLIWKFSGKGKKNWMESLSHRNPISIRIIIVQFLKLIFIIYE